MLAAYAELYGQVQRKLFADVAAGRSAVALKSEYIKKHGIPARMFNAVRVLMEGKVASVKEQPKLRVDGLRHRIASAERQVGRDKQHGRWDLVHQQQRRLDNLGSGLAGLEADMSARRVRLCFGSKRLWRKQRHLEAMATPAVRNGLRTGKLLAATSSSCWAAGMKRQDVSCALRRLPTTARCPCVCGRRIAWRYSSASTWPWRACGLLRPRAGARCLGEQRRVCQVSTAAW